MAKAKKAGEDRRANEIQLADLKKANQQLQQEIQARSSKINQIEPKIQAEQSKIEDLKKEITVDNLKKIFNYLDTKYSEAPAYVMEALVGLMRKMRRADIKSVELYTKSYEGFSIGLGRIRLEELNFDHCADHVNQLSTKYSSLIESQKELEIFLPYHNLLK